MKITQYVLPVVVGAMAGMMLITLGEMFIRTIYPLAIGTDLYDADSVASAMKNYPSNALVMLLMNDIICSFLAGLIATLIAKRETVRPAIVIGIVLTLAGLYKVVYLPHPVWFSITDLVSYFPFAYLGYRVVRRDVSSIVY